MELGRLDAVPPRSVWLKEAHDFTPWLLANADRLADALGIDVELRAAEHPVGGFSLDLFGRDVSNDTILIVENQLEPTDHGHLGQILTYAAGTGASTIVWVATSFPEEHRQALDWLNEKTADDVHFFGVELSVVRIGDSRPAPLLEVVAKPNEWQKRVRTATRAGSVSPRAEQYREFWSRYLERTAGRGWGRRQTPQPANWMNFPSPISGTQLNPSFAAGGRLRHELYIDTGDGSVNLAIFQALAQHRTDFEAAYGRPLSFEELPGKRASRIADYTEGTIENQESWDDYIDWFIDSGERIRRAVGEVTEGRIAIGSSEPPDDRTSTGDGADVGSSL
ncbi:MAG TPA: DUF4268 domain-containing protein [Acidimicrobiales bacterium]|nr:DUF4268 domain-containing protein [Acidimicrobiales bacterium]